MSLRAWKFVVPANEWIPDPEDPKREYQGCLSVAVAKDAEAARAALVGYAAAFGFDVGWLRAAKVSEIPLDVPGAVLCWVST